MSPQTTRITIHIVNTHKLQSIHWLIPPGENILLLLTSTSADLILKFKESRVLLSSNIIFPCVAVSLYFYVFNLLINKIT